MRIELCCPNCSSRFAAPPDAPQEQVLEQMFEDGPAYALGDGETFEDMIFSTLTENGHIACPECGEQVCVSEESLSRLALSMLDTW